MSITPTSTLSEYNSPFSASSNAERRFIGQRRLSAPSSPGPDVRALGKERERDASPPPTPGPSQARTPRKRASHAVTLVEREEYRKRYEDDEQKEEDIMAAALAAVASSRNPESIGASGSRGKRNPTRQLLPLEFHDKDRREDDEVCDCIFLSEDFS